jgi:tetratricopeptide (TPR) repeat protein
MNLQELHVSGIQASQEGRHGDAVALLERLVALAPVEPTYHANLGLALVRAGEPGRGASSYQVAVELRPGHGPTLAKLGRALAAAGQEREAIAVFRRALAVDSGDPDTWNALGAACANAGRLDEACGSFERAIELDPNHDEAVANLLAATLQQAEADVAQQNWAGAATQYERAARLDPGNAEYPFNSGCALMALGRLDEAAQCYRRSLAIETNHPKTLNNLGNVLVAKGRLIEAVGYFERAIEADPAYLQARYNLANTWQQRGEVDLALSLYRSLIAEDPTHADAQNNTGSLLLSQANPASALAAFEAALRAQPDHLDAAWNRALAQLSMGNFDDGWKNYESRLERPNRPVHHDEIRQWRGEDLQGKAILVWAEQGLGDTLQFLRYLPLVKQAGARVVFECQARLKALLAGVPGIDELYARPEPLPGVDFQIPLMSLPAVTQTNAIPPPAPLPVPESVRERWHAEVRKLPGLRIGLCWLANPKSPSGALRSAPLGQLLTLAEIPGATFVSLQREISPADSATLRAHGVVELEQEGNTLADTAAIIGELDLVISVDTMIAHLAATLNRPTYLLLPFAADWRWTYSGETTAWYPSARLFRQPAPGDWKGLFARTRQVLAEWLHSSKPE